MVFKKQIHQALKMNKKLDTPDVRSNQLTRVTGRHLTEAITNLKIERLRENTE